jgi:hypothetical protein
MGESTAVRSGITRALAQALYGLFGIVYLVAGASVLLLGTGLLPVPVRDLIMSIGEGTPNTLHIMQELASLMVFAGLITLWFMLHYERSLAFHWAMTVFWGLFALVHWFDIRGGFDPDIGNLINTIPFGLFLLVGVLRMWSERKAAAG